MSAGQISISLDDYRIGVESIRSMSESITDYSKSLPTPDSTNMPVLLEYINKLGELNGVLLQYGELLQKDIKDMQQIADNFEEMDEANSIQ